VRLLLDAHVSVRGVGRALIRDGHDVLALSEYAAHEGLDDEEVLALATAAERVLVTHDVEDFPPILREWGAEGRSHAGVILIHGIGHREFGVVLGGLRMLLNERDTQAAWIDVCEILSRGRLEP
jgi:predicted nuclease of predicted toxin-antitoxin system